METVTVRKKFSSVSDYLINSCIERALVFENESVFVKFCDNVCIFLESDGMYFTLRLPSGKEVKHLTCCATTSLKDKLLHTIKFRNHFIEKPLIIPNLHGNYTNFIFSSYSKWPYFPEKLLFSLTDDFGIQVFSRDRLVSLYLFPNRRCFKVYFGGMLTNENLKLSGLNSKSITTSKYIFEQMFPVSHFPLRWQHPLKLAFTIASNPDYFKDLSDEDNSHPKVDLDIIVSLPDVDVLKVGTKQKSFWIENNQKEHVTVSEPLLHVFGDSFPKDVLVFTELNENAIFWSLPNAPYISEVFIFLDESYLVSSERGDFYKHHIEYPDEDLLEKKSDVFKLKSSNDSYFSDILKENYLTDVKIYWIDSLPPRFYCKKSNKSYDIKSILKHSHKMQSNSNKIMKLRMLLETSENDLDCDIGFSSKIKDSAEVPFVGIFDFYCDQRVKARFYDRTMLELSSNGDNMKVISCKGQHCAGKTEVIWSTFPMFQFHINWSRMFQNWVRMDDESKTISKNESTLKSDIIIQEQVRNERLLKLQNMLFFKNNEETKSYEQKTEEKEEDNYNTEKVNITLKKNDLLISKNKKLLNENN